MNIVTVTANAAVDTTLFLDVLKPGELNRTIRVERRAGGKGNNVARILNALGHDVVATGFSAGSNGRWIEETLRADGIRTEFVNVKGQSRTCYTLVETTTRRSTEVVERGPTIDEDKAQELIVMVQKWAKWADVHVLSGSLPTGLKPDYYALLVKAAREHGCEFVVLDTSGLLLQAGLAGKPHLIKPNQSELESLVGPVKENMDMAINQVRKSVLPCLESDGFLLISLGSRGLLGVGAHHDDFIPAPQIPVVNTVGCGDALLAGFIHSFKSGGTLLSSMKYAVACGGAAALQDTAGYISLDDVERLRAEMDEGGNVK